MRKTVEVQDLKDKVNRMIEKSDTDLVEGREALSVLIETVLLETGNYKGFQFEDGENGRVDESKRRYL